MINRFGLAILPFIVLSSWLFARALATGSALAAVTAFAALLAFSILFVRKGGD